MLQHTHNTRAATAYHVRSIIVIIIIVGCVRFMQSGFVFRLINILCVLLGGKHSSSFCCKCAHNNYRKFKIEDGENTTPSSWVSGFLFYSESWGIFLASFLSSLLHIIIHFCPEAASITVLVNYKATSAYESKMLHIFQMDTSRTRESETHNLIHIKLLGDQ